MPLVIQTSQFAKIVTIVNVQNEQPLSFSKRRDNIEIELVGMFSDLSLIPLVVGVRLCRFRISSKINVEVIEHIREIYKFCRMMKVKRLA